MRLQVNHTTRSGHDQTRRSLAVQRPWHQREEFRTNARNSSQPEVRNAGSDVAYGIHSVWPMISQLFWWMWLGLADCKALMDIPVRADRFDHESPALTVYQ